MTDDGTLDNPQASKSPAEGQPEAPQDEAELEWTDESDTEGLQEEEVPSIPAPGLPESMLWLLAFFVLQIVTGIFVVIIVALMSVENFADLKSFDFNQLSPNVQMLTVGIPSVLTYVVLIPLGLWRMSPKPIQKLQFRLPTWKQLAIAASLVVPFQFLADFSFRAFEPVWQNMVEAAPVLKPLSETDVHTMLGELSGASLLSMLFFVAVVPAVGEEFLFRGLIGRGLNARWGVIMGVAWTSLFFAMVHLYPPHVVAILPVGFAMHYVYLQTKNFLLPVMFHFINNSLATFSMKFGSTETETSDWVFWVAVAYIPIGMWALYQARTREEKVIEHRMEPASPSFEDPFFPPQTESSETTISMGATVGGVLAIGVLIWHAVLVVGSLEL